MRANMVGWLGLVVVALVSVATSKPKRGSPPRPGLLTAELSDTVTLIDGQPLMRRYKVRLAAAANIDGGMPRQASLELNRLGCVRELDAGTTCHTSSLGPAVFNFANGFANGEVALFSGCGVDIDCEESVVVEVGLSDSISRTVTAEVLLRATVQNAASSELSHLLTIVPE